MNKAMIAVVAIAASGTAFAGGHTGGDSGLDLELGGFIWADVGTGDRYDGSDDDQTGISKAAVTVSTSVDNVTAGMTLGVDNAINSDLGSNGSDGDDIEVKEAWIAFDFDIADITIGKQALGFGLKPAGWVGGRPINDGLEFGGALDLNQSGQVVTGIAADFALGANLGLRAAIFDSEDSGADNSMTDNFMLQLRSDDLFGTGIYASLGYEESGTSFGDLEATSIGAGYDFGVADISLEYQQLDVDESAVLVTPAAEFETLILAVGIPLNDSTGIYIDYAMGEADVSACAICGNLAASSDTADTLRVGMNFSYNDNVDFILEYSDDDYDSDFADAGGFEDADSIDLRVALSF